MRSGFFLLAFLLGWLGVTGPILAQGSALEHRYIYDVWQETEGLPGNDATSVVQTPDGYVWVGTGQGLGRFDGLRFEVFDSGTSGLMSREIRKLFVDDQGGLWVAMASGDLARCAAGVFKAFHAADGWSMKPVRSFAMGRSNSVTVVDVVGAVFSFQGGRFNRAFAAPEGAAEPIRELVRDSAGEGWAIGSERKLHGLVRGSWQPFLPVGDHAPPLVDLLVAAKGGGVWVFGGQEIKLLDQGLWTRRLDMPPELALASVTCSLADSLGNLWVGTASSRLFRFGTNGLVQTFSPANGFPPGNLSELYEDREGSVWCASKGGGLIRLKPAVFETFGISEGLPPQPILSLAEDLSGRLVLGTQEGGLLYLDNGRFSGPLTVLGKPMSIWALQLGREGEIWAGAHGDGLLRLHGQKSAQWGQSNGLVQAGVTSLYQDRAGILWVGGESGLSRFDGNSFKYFSTADGLLSGTVKAIAQDPSGDLWVGTSTGLNRMRNGKFTTFSKRDGLPGEQVHSLLVGRDGGLWIGTRDGGLGRFCEGRFSAFTLKHGLPDNSIATILEDGLGYLWLGTERGICRVALSQFDVVARGQQLRLECSIYLKKDGLTSINCSAGNPGGIVARDGRLWFAMARGVSVVDPRNTRPNMVPPMVAFEEVLLDGEVAFSNRRAEPSETQMEQGVLQLPAGCRRMEIAYAGLSFTSPTQTRYRVRLEGVDKGWRDAGTRRLASFDGLSPGTYRFHVAAANSCKRRLKSETGSRV